MTSQRSAARWLRIPYRWLRQAGASALGRRLVGVRWLNETYHALLASWVRRARMVDVNGYRLWLDAHDYCGLLMGSYESETTAWMMQTVHRGDVVVDAGAFIGYYTLLLSQLVGPDGHVFAFEPEPRAFALLQRNVQENGFRNVTLVPQALGERSGRQALQLTRSGFGGEMTEAPADGSGRRVDVERTSLDEFFTGFARPIALIKMDIEGREAAALRGASRLLRQSDPALLVELNPAALRRAGVEPAALLEELAALGFEPRRVESPGRPLDPSLELPALLASAGSANLIARRDWTAPQACGAAAAGSAEPA